MALELVAIFLVAMVLRVAFLDRQCLWPDEIFSLAIATGHSLEHPATAANPSLGDFVEPAYPAQREEFVRYVQQENPPASPARVLRAAFLSDTSPPLITYHYTSGHFCSVPVVQPFACSQWPARLDVSP